MDVQMVGFYPSARSVTILNSRSASSNETELRNGIRSWKAHLLSQAERQEPKWWPSIQQKVNDGNFTAIFRI
jgi:hypothetical protein